MINYQYKAIVKRIIDGDSLVVDIDLGLYSWRHNVHLRLDGIDTPETRGEERPKGLLAKKRLKELLPDGKEIKIITKKPDKYGRVLCTIELKDGTNINKLLLDEGYAKVYNIKDKNPTFPLNEKYPLR